MTVVYTTTSSKMVPSSILSTEFEMKDLGVAKKILGMDIYMDRR